jgi:hypothetical protein
MRQTLTMVFIVVVLTGVLNPCAVLAALTVSGTIPPGRTVVVIPANPRGIPAGILKLKFSSPADGAILSFCVGSPANPCGERTSFVVTVRPGEEKLAVIDAIEFFKGAVLVVAQGTSSIVGYSVSIE